MTVEMFFKILSITERLGAVGTDKRTLPSVNPLMDKQLRFGVATLSTIRTFERGDNISFLLGRFRCLGLAVALNMFDQIIKSSADFLADHANLFSVSIRSMIFDLMFFDSF